jgi:ribosomal protein L6P/L9E
VPSYIKIFSKKRRFFIIGSNILKFNEFLMKIRQIKKIDLYKGKGLLEIKAYKNFIKMKSGKKKQY